MTTSADMPTAASPPDSNPSILTRLLRFFGRLILAFLKLLPVFLIVAVMLAAAWLGYLRLSYSFGEVNSRFDTAAEQTAQLQDQISTLSTGLTSHRSEMAANTAEMESRISASDEQLAQQAEMLSALDLRIAALEASIDSSAQNISALDEGLRALQSDLSENGLQLDTQAGQIDSLGLDLSAMRDDIAANAEAVAQKETLVGRLAKTLTLFHVWETVARARLRLADENIGLAQADIDMAQMILTQMVAEESGDLADALTLIQTRLDLASSALPDDSAAAIRDLDSAWEALDSALSLLLEESILAES